MVTFITTSVASLVQSTTVCVTKNVYSPSVSASEVSAVSVKSSSVYQIRPSPSVTSTSARVCPSSSDCGDSISGGVIPSQELVTFTTTSTASLIQSPIVCVTKNVYSPSVSASEVSAVSVTSCSFYLVRPSPSVTSTSARVCPSSSDCGDSISGGVIPSHGSVSTSP